MQEAYDGHGLLEKCMMMDLIANLQELETSYIYIFFIIMDDGQPPLLLAHRTYGTSNAILTSASSVFVAYANDRNPVFAFPVGLNLAVDTGL